MSQGAGAPLQGRRVLVTRAPHQSSELAERLREVGAQPILIPTISIAEPESYCALDAALTCLSTYDWMVLTSANAVEAFHRRAQRNRISQVPKRVAAIGPATERAARAAGLRVDLVPRQAVAESLAEELVRLAAGANVLLVRAAEARDVVPEALRGAGAMVTIAEAYRNEVPTDSVIALRALLGAREGLPDAVTFTSASCARNLATILEEGGLVLPEAVVRASIGPITSEALRELDLPPQVQAAEPSVVSLVEALGRYFASR